ncbi:uncharacterized protein CLAFUR5_10260 [Fulvia fulva]|uniref:AB hydrolase-1 domain-containing protein n=1 Tax=Passalora fulva TaxID=5499 RepID=A0A9Q8URF9_PASFU|nr:uncharacterized protein CLAFUR5_10260 [Fulvia fulva]UJO19764.1 hypothetical protein CLAFUR5_10260 [Fulvia fulva]
MHRNAQTTRKSDIENCCLADRHRLDVSAPPAGTTNVACAGTVTAGHVHAFQRSPTNHDDDDFISADRTDVPLKPYAQNEELKIEWVSTMTKDGFTSPNCWYRALKEDYHLDTEKGLDGKLDKPYLFIASDGDAVCRTDAIERAKGSGLVPDHEVHEVHSGHWAPFEQQDQISKIVLEWLKKKGFSGL